MCSVYEDLSPVSLGFLRVLRFPPGTPVSSGYSGFLRQKTDFIVIISPPWYDPGCCWGVKPQKPNPSYHLDHHPLSSLVPCKAQAACLAMLKPAPRTTTRHHPAPPSRIDGPRDDSSFPSMQCTTRRWGARAAARNAQYAPQPTLAPPHCPPHYYVITWFRKVLGRRGSRRWTPPTHASPSLGATVARVQIGKLTRNPQRDCKL